MSKGRISTDGGAGLGQNPFAALPELGGNRSSETGDRKPETGDRNVDPGNGGTETVSAHAGSIRNPQSSIRNRKSRGRVDIRRETGGRGGKTVTVIDGFVGIGLPEKEQLAKKIRGVCGCGGTIKDGAIVIQGDHRATISRILSEAGFRPVFAGGGGL